MARDYTEELKRYERLYAQIETQAQKRKEKIAAKIAKLRKLQAGA